MLFLNKSKPDRFVVLDIHRSHFGTRDSCDEEIAQKSASDMKPSPDDITYLHRDPLFEITRKFLPEFRSRSLDCNPESEAPSAGTMANSAEIGDQRTAPCHLMIEMKIEEVGFRGLRQLNAMG
jgi:hypothetical protein